METAKQLLERKGKQFPGYDEFSPSEITFMCDAMEEYKSQFKDKPVTELNERNSVDEGEKSFVCCKKCNDMRFCEAISGCKIEWSIQK